MQISNGTLYKLTQISSKSTISEKPVKLEGLIFLELDSSQPQQNLSQLKGRSDWTQISESMSQKNTEDHVFGHRTQVNSNIIQLMGNPSQLNAARVNSKSPDNSNVSSAAFTKVCRNGLTCLASKSHKWLFWLQKCFKCLPT